MCFEFQVKRYSTPWQAAVAMCRASAPAFFGNPASRTSISANWIAASLMSRSGIPLSTFEPAPGGFGIAGGYLLDHEL